MVQMELKEFTLPFVGLKQGKHNFSFAIDNKVFEHFGFDDFHKTKLEGKLVLDKKPSSVKRKKTFFEILFFFRN